LSAIGQVRALYEYNEWADNHVLDAAARLSPEELALDRGASFGSVRDNLAHIASAQLVWSSRWLGEPARPLETAAGRGFDELRALFQSSHSRLRQFVASLAEESLERVLSYVDTEGRPHERVVWQTMLHLVNHGTHHRAETAMVLTSLGKAPRQLDYVFYEIERGGGAPPLT
jgi:uncharacterized damage-inducible protein DinB